MTKKRILFAVMIPVFGALIIGCATTAPFTFTDTFNVSSDHFREIRRGPWEAIGTTYYRLIVDHDEKIIHVRGRGSEREDLRDNLDFRIREPAEEWFPEIEARIRVHSGFLRRYEAAREVLMDALYRYPAYAVRVSGFSLGATWPQLFLLDVTHHWPDRDIQAILYGPANPWRRLPREYQRELQQRTVFVRTYWDPVTWMRVLGFFRYGHTITIGRWWRVLPPQHFPPQMIRALDERF